MVFKSSFEDILPDPKFKESLALFIWDKLDEFSDRELIVSHLAGRRWTGAKIKAEALKIARYLIDELQFSPRELCHYQSDHDDYVLIVLIAVLFSGGAFSYGDPEDPPRESLYSIKFLRPSVVFSAIRCYDRLEESCRILSEEGELTKTKLCISDDENCKHPLSKIRIGLHSCMISAETTDLDSKEIERLQLPRLVEPDDPAIVLFTSGSTGVRKPVSRSHRNCIYTCFTFPRVPKLWKWCERPVIAGHLPLNHGTGIFSFKMTMSLGATLVVMPEFGVEIISDAIEQHRITDAIMGSGPLDDWIRSPYTGSKDLSSLTTIMSTGAPSMSFARNIEFMKLWPNLRIRTAFGMSEVGFISIVPYEEAMEDTVTVGALVPNVMVKLMEQEEGRHEIREIDQIGELFVKTPTRSPGYLGVELVEQSKQAFLEDGYYRSKDLACITEPPFVTGGVGKQRLQVRGRLGDCITLLDGLKLMPDEIEEVINEHPQVAECAVIGIPRTDYKFLQMVRAFVVPIEPDCGLAGEEIYEWVAERVNYLKRLEGGVKILDKLPRSALLGKVDKKALREMQL